MSSFWEEMSIIRRRRLDREKQQARGVLASMKSAITNGIASNVNTESSAPKQAARFNTPKPAKVKAPTSGELQSRWFDLVAEEMQQSGCDRMRATSIVGKKHPKLRAEMIEAANRERAARRR